MSALLKYCINHVMLTLCVASVNTKPIISQYDEIGTEAASESPNVISSSMLLLFTG